MIRLVAIANTLLLVVISATFLLFHQNSGRDSEADAMLQEIIDEGDVASASRMLALTEKSRQATEEVARRLFIFTISLLLVIEIFVIAYAIKSTRKRVGGVGRDNGLEQWKTLAPRRLGK
jgi:hypothetical protein